MKIYFYSFLSFFFSLIFLYYINIKRPQNQCLFNSKLFQKKSCQISQILEIISRIYKK